MSVLLKWFNSCCPWSHFYVPLLYLYTLRHLFPTQKWSLLKSIGHGSLCTGSNPNCVKVQHNLLLKFLSSLDCCSNCLYKSHSIYTIMDVNSSNIWSFSAVDISAFFSWRESLLFFLLVISINILKTALLLKAIALHNYIITYLHIAYNYI